tara:strand:+ start:307 stop:618 length:312 start_codon:yes stop_codon:yes gene_type:complete
MSENPVQQLKEKLLNSQVREMTDVTDVCTLMMGALLSKRIKPGESREIRQWAELLFTSVQAATGEGNDINYITQLIQMNNIEAPQELTDSQPEMQPQLLTIGE